MNFSQEAVQEFKVFRNQFEAEYASSSAVRRSSLRLASTWTVISQ
jgi:hypothetical protein